MRCCRKLARIQSSLASLPTKECLASLPPRGLAPQHSTASAGSHRLGTELEGSLVEGGPRQPGLQQPQQLHELGPRVAGEGEQLGPAACPVKVRQGPLGQVYGVGDAHQDQAGARCLQAGATPVSSSAGLAGGCGKRGVVDAAGAG